MSEGFGFYFEKAGRSAPQGAIDPAEQYFEGSAARDALGRETGQNTIDADDGVGPVTMVFELAEMETDSIPDIMALRAHLKQVVEATEGKQGHDRMRAALEVAERDTVHVLRIGDYGTKGLAGSESVDHPGSPLSALTRGAGISSDDGTRGGSFGIGSAVGPAASDLRTVLYTSLPVGADKVVFAGYSRLASHRDDDGVWRSGDGFFTDLGNEDDFEYLRGPEPVGPFTARTEPGTDIYVLAYRMAEEDADLKGIRDAFVHNFMLAIDRGHLIVKGKSPAGEWELNAETLEQYAKEILTAWPFYVAIHDEEPITSEHPKLGELKLYVNIDDTLERSLHTIAVRRPLMKIATYRHTSISAKYAAVFECSNISGNTLLRDLEPPQHHEWDPYRALGGYALVNDIKSFIREGLKSRVKQQLGDKLEIKGLARFLPADLLAGDSASTTGGAPAIGDGVAEESATVTGKPGESVQVFNSEGKSVAVTVTNPATAGGPEPGTKGRDAGGEGQRKTREPGIPGEVGDGDGRSRIRAGTIRFRSWSTGPLSIVIAVSTDIEQGGDIELAPLGPGGTPEEGYVLPISKAHMVVDGEKTALVVSGNVLRDVVLPIGMTRIALELSSSHRYRWG